MEFCAAPPRIETERLLLRRPVKADAEQIFSRYASDADVTRYMSFRCHTSLDDTRMFLDFAEFEWNTTGCGPYLVLSRDNVMLGSTGLSLYGDHAETGYLFARDAWGHGYATESLRSMVCTATGMGLRELTARCHPDHRASMHVLQKCGFVLQRRALASLVFPNLTDEKQDALCYSLRLAA